MEPETTIFFQQKLLALLRQLKPDQQPEWGLLNPQAMVEHLTSSWRISNGRAEAAQQTTEEQAKAYRAFLENDQALAPNTKNSVLPKDKAPELRKPDLQSAIDQLEADINQFFHYFSQYPESKPVHPLFGPLTQTQWLQFQTKHVKHHLRQFNLISDETARLS